MFGRTPSTAHTLQYTGSHTLKTRLLSVAGSSSYNRLETKPGRPLPVNLILLFVRTWLLVDKLLGHLDISPGLSALEGALCCNLPAPLLQVEWPLMFGVTLSHDVVVDSCLQDAVGRRGLTGFLRGEICVIFCYILSAEILRSQVSTYCI